MRISLLLEREPFAEILQQTLSEYWSKLHGSQVKVEWVSRRDGAANPTSQEWLANIYLNAIFRPRIDSRAFDPIRREYARSLVAWKTPIQRQYVRWATNQVTSRWFAQARMLVSPEVERSESQLIIPGNQKIRILNHQDMTSTCLLKSGFADHAFRNEVRARQLAAELKVPTPRLELTHNRWFREEYVSGTPLNRLDSSAKASRHLRHAVSCLRNFVSETQQVVSVSNYVERLSTEAEGYANRENRYERKIRDSILKRVRDLREFVLEQSDSDDDLTLTETHGDFQPANVLVRDDQMWLIDWENSQRRQSAYDLFVFEFESRGANDLSRRMMAAVANGATTLLAESQWVGLKWSESKERFVKLTLFLMEEINWHLKENDNNLFGEPSHGLQRMLRESQVWLNAKVHRTLASPAC